MKFTPAKRGSVGVNPNCIGWKIWTVFHRSTYGSLGWTKDIFLEFIAFKWESQKDYWLGLGLVALC